VKYYSYFPGCSCAEGSGKAYNKSVLAVAKSLDIDLKELDEWNCCGSTPYFAYDELGSMSLAARDLALAEKRGFDLVTPCSCCYVIFNKTNLKLKKFPELKSKVDGALAAGGLRYSGDSRVRHILDIIVNDIGFDNIAGKVKKGLNGLKIAPYYGCQIVRPDNIFDHADNPMTLDKLMLSLQAEVVDYPLKTACCGSSKILSEEDVALGLIRNILNCAETNGAQCIVTVCPLCQMNVDAYQSVVNKKFGTNYHIPVLFFTQLMGIAFGLPEKQLDIKSSIVSPHKVLAKYL
jgi:heterodisulfide reductase subunit B2